MTSFPNFNGQTTATEVASAFSEHIKGKNVLLVGVSPASLGEFMAKAIAAHDPALFILASRSKDKIDAVISELPKNAKTAAVEVDLSAQESIRRVASEIQSLAPELDVIINNAGINVQDFQLTKEQLEMHFGTNHIGLFLLTNLLLKSPKTRIVNLTSAGHRLSPIRFSDYNFSKPAKDLPVEERPPSGLPPAFTDSENPYNGFVAYGQSKTANILYSVSLVERGLVSYAVHPGSIWTGLSRSLDEEGLNAIKGTAKNWKNGDQGAATTIVAAFDPNLEHTQGKSLYMADCQLADAAPHATDPKAAERLWKLSEELVGQAFTF